MGDILFIISIEVYIMRQRLQSGSVKSFILLPNHKPPCMVRLLTFMMIIT